MCQTPHAPRSAILHRNTSTTAPCIGVCPNSFEKQKLQSTKISSKARLFYIGVYQPTFQVEMIGLKADGLVDACIEVLLID